MVTLIFQWYPYPNPDPTPIHNPTPYDDADLMDNETFLKTLTLMITRQLT